MKTLLFFQFFPALFCSEHISFSGREVFFCVFLQMHRLHSQEHFIDTIHINVAEEFHIHAQTEPGQAVESFFHTEFESVAQNAVRSADVVQKCRLIFLNNQLSGGIFVQNQLADNLRKFADDPCFGVAESYLI